MIAMYNAVKIGNFIFFRGASTTRMKRFNGHLHACPPPLVAVKS
jgi:hypothetical protein